MMTYTKSFEESKYSEIQEALDQLTNLEAGAEVSISGLNPFEMGKVRWLVYDWLHHMGAKKNFRIRSDYDRQTVIIKRIGLTSSSHVSLNRSTLPEGLTRILESLVSLDNQKQAEEQLSQMAMDRKITPTELGQLLLELRRVYS